MRWGVAINTAWGVFSVAVLVSMSIGDQYPAMVSGLFWLAYAITAATLACAAFGWWRLWRIHRRVGDREPRPGIRRMEFWRASGW